MQSVTGAQIFVNPEFFRMKQLQYAKTLTRRICHTLVQDRQRGRMGVGIEW